MATRDINAMVSAKSLFAGRENAIVHNLLSHKFHTAFIFNFISR